MVRGALRWLLVAGAISALGAVACPPPPGVHGVTPMADPTTEPLDAFVAAARLFGYVRYFHPTDEARSADWNDLAATMMERASAARDAVELASALREAVAPYAPSVQVWPSGPAGAPPEPPAIDAPYVVRHRHYGVTVNEAPSVYRSERQTLSRAEAPPLPWSLVKELGGGVSCRFAAVLPADPVGTLPRASTPRPPARSHEPRFVRLASIAVAWNVFQHFYPYFDVVDTDWLAALRAGLEGARSAKDERAFAATLRELVAKLHDGHGFVSNPSEKPSLLPIAWTWASGELVVTVANGGLLRGDVILSIDGRTVAELRRESSKRISAATEGFAWHRALDEMARIDTPDPFEVVVRRPSGEVARVTMARARTGDYRAPRPPNGSEIAPGILYLDLSGMASKELAERMPALVEAKGIVFDARGYPSSAGIDLLEHLASGDMTSAEWHIPIVLLPDREKMTFEHAKPWRLRPRAPHLAMPVAFVIDARAISYAESCLEVVEHYGLGALVGERTAGTNGNVNPFELPGGYRVSWTGMRVLKHGGRQHHGIGVAPTVEAHRTPKGIAEGRDEMIEKAVEVVRGRTTAR